MSDPILSFPWHSSGDPQFLLSREWLVTNGLGGYASGTLLGVATRRYHSPFTPNLPSPWGRTVLLPHLDESLQVGERTIRLDTVELEDGRITGEWPHLLREFRLDWMVPTWRFDLGRGLFLERRIFMPFRQNSSYILYTLEGQESIGVVLRPYIAFRAHDGAFEASANRPIAVISSKRGCEFPLVEGAPPLKLALSSGEEFTRQGKPSGVIAYRQDRERGGEYLAELSSPGYFSARLSPGEPIAFVASTEPWESLAANALDVFEAERQRQRRLLSLAPPAARVGMAAQLVLAADQFIVLPGSRLEERVLTQTAGDEAWTIIAGYHWFTDWGRDTMISLEGLTLCTGRHREAGAILRTFSRYLEDGLIPNLFPEGQRRALYHTADATFWYFHAIDRYETHTGDKETLRLLFPGLKSVIDHHIRGTRFGIGVDPRDGLIREGTEGLPLTWMDARVGDWVVTARRGKPVEIQALWYNALCLMARWAEELGEPAEGYYELARQANQSFNARFWYEAGGYLYDVIDGEHGDDASLRPNQIFALSLRFPILVQARWRAVVDIVAQRLLTPVGLRSLDPRHPEYRPRYFGDLRSRDAAYHQGTVWGWLIGSFNDARRRVYGEDSGVSLDGFKTDLFENGIGTISEIFDAEPPHVGRGCIAQAWSVAEVLRTLLAARQDPYFPLP